MRHKTIHIRGVFLFITFLLLSLNNNALAQNWCISDQTYSRDGNGGERFGYAVAIYGNYAIVGAPEEESDAAGSHNLNKAGAVYFYHKDNSGKWEFMQKLVAPDRKKEDFFGHSVDIYDDYAIIGAFRKDDPYSRSKDVGAVYICHLGSDGKWEVIQEIFASDKAKNAQFGQSLSISENNILVGAWKEKEDENGKNSIDNAGAAYLFTKNFFLNRWSQAQKIVSPERSKDDYFGESVSISGNTMLIGASYHDEENLNEAGAVYGYINTFWDNWTFINKLEPSDRTEKGHFGHSISISNDYALIGAYGDNKDNNGNNPVKGAGSASLFRHFTTKGWEFSQKITAENRADNDRFGWDVSLSNTNAFIGAPKKAVLNADNSLIPEAGTVSIFKNSGTGELDPIKMLSLQEPRKGDQWGFSLASSTGSLLVGSPYHDKIDESGDNVISNSGAVSLLEPCDDITIFNEVSICNGDSIFLQGDFQSEAGTYYDVYPLPAGNDSIVITELSIIPITVTKTTASICEGESIWLGGAYQTEPGVYTDSLVATTGCDSILITELTVFPVNITNLEAEICEGDRIWLGGAYQMEAGTYYDTLTSISGCDSILITELSVFPVSVTSISTQICEGDSILLGGSFRTKEGIYNDTLIAITGCDSILVTELTLIPISRINMEAEICEGDRIWLGGAYQTQPGTYYDIFTASTGCDSIIITELSVLPVSKTSLSSQICEGDSIMIGGSFRKESGTFYDTLMAVTGCDSIFITELYVIPVSRTYRDEDICEGQRIWLGGDYQTESGIYTDIYTASTGCDSIIITNLTVLPAPKTSVFVQICEGDSILVNGEYVDKAGIYTDTIPNPFGCDSISITYVTMFPASETRVDATICNGDSLFLAGSYQHTSGVYYDTLPSVIGCDSIIATTLIVSENQSYTIERIRSICRGDSIWLENAYQKTEGVFMDTNIIAPCGDTLIIETTLSINPQARIDLGEDAQYCTGQSITVDAGPGFVYYSWNNGIFDTRSINVETSGTWHVTGTDVNGCTDDDTINLVFEVCTNIPVQNKTPMDIFIYPNPTSGKVTLELGDKLAEKNLEISIMNTLGKVLLHKTVKSRKTIKFDISTFPKGLYYLNIQNSKTGNTIQIILK